jgi:hypothetical protein
LLREGDSALPTSVAEARQLELATAPVRSQAR